MARARYIDLFANLCYHLIGGDNMAKSAIWNLYQKKKYKKRLINAIVYATCLKLLGTKEQSLLSFRNMKRSRVATS